MKFNNVGVMPKNGFTLLELMATIFIMALLAAFSVRTYQQHMVSSYQNQAQANIMALASQLAEWQAKALTYKGFVPYEGYSNADNITIYMPANSNDQNYKYIILLRDMSDSSAWVSLKDPSAVGQQWQIIANPNPDLGIMKKALSIYANSKGVQCMASTAQDASTCTNSTSW